MIEIFLHAFVALFVVIDPVGTAGVYVGLGEGRSAQELRRMALTAVMLAVLILVFFAVVGEPLLQTIGISLPAFRIAGGLLLFVTAYRMVMVEPRPGLKAMEEERMRDLSVFPLAIPLLAGPGTMTTMILLMDQAGDSSGNQVMVLMAMLLVELLALLCLWTAPSLHRVLGKAGTALLGRLFGVLLAALAVQFIADGVKGLL